jgi:hypothetical protein
MDGLGGQQLAGAADSGLYQVTGWREIRRLPEMSSTARKTSFIKTSSREAQSAK